ncbi:ABC-F family ATP-binding cassette domain-containing protein [Listeria sp. PSOL-1]|uniref:ABC-F family ATP-binding cassette domain-containing protein n=1 Tax=Listeria sp. PSOL-1 TaxID=1844999 RepID=UPI0013D8C93B|nr:ABC-F type ribosomal protection protein [Listeria sp. PSOL-1]
MILLQVQQINKYFGADLILENMSLEVKTNDRIALVGRNGAGKSTLLKIIAGQMSSDSGSISKPKQVKIGYLAQNTGLESSKTIWHEMLSVFDDLRQMEQELREFEQKLGKPEIYEQPESYAQLLKDYDLMQHRFKELGGYQYEAEMRSILHSLHFYQEDFDKLIASLSGGQKTRLALAKLLLEKHDVLILDEPTNHLDIATLSWLENYLQNYSGALLIVSHDRYFLDKVVNQVYEISRTKIKRYTGNYSHYLKQKQAQFELDLKKFDKQQTQISKLEDFIARNIANSATTKRAQSRRKQLEKIDFLDRPQGHEKTAHFGFTFKQASGKDVLSIDELSIGYPNNQATAEQITFEAKRADSISLIGPNGVGKTTLLKTLTGELPAISGHFQFGIGVKIGYYDQEQAKLTSNKNILHEIWDDYPERTEQEIRTTLGNFLFSNDDVLKIVNTLSGGEKARLALAKLTLLDANVLILDEPTNHLDIESKEILEAALIHFAGTILFVSHDRYFINKIASKIVELTQTGTTVYLGDYDYYQEKISEAKEIARLKREEQLKNNTTLKQNQPKSAKTSYKESKESQKLIRQKTRQLADIEVQMEKTDAKIAELEEKLTEPEVFGNHETALRITDELDGLRQVADALMEDWEMISEELEALR